MNKFTFTRIHHISMMSGSAQETLDFYRDVLGLKLIKQTLNFGDPTMYHLFFVNQLENPEMILTLFPNEEAKQGVRGNGQVGRVAFRIPKDSLNYWENKLNQHQVEYQSFDEQYGQGVLFEDFHSIKLALIETQDAAPAPDIVGFHGVELLSKRPDVSKDQLINIFGLKALTSSTEYHLLETVGELKQQILIPRQELVNGQYGIGIGHHIAWEVPNEEDLEDLITYFKDQGLRPTSIKDRKYFQSIYMRDHGWVMHEVTTKGPGFLIDETFEELGQNLQIPPHYTDMTDEIMQKMNPIY